MHNLVSHNELATWKWDEKDTADERYDQVSDYFQCIAESGITDHAAKRFCRHILTAQTRQDPLKGDTRPKSPPCVGIGSQTIKLVSTEPGMTPGFVVLQVYKEKTV